MIKNRGMLLDRQGVPFSPTIPVKCMMMSYRLTVDRPKFISQSNSQITVTHIIAAPWF